MRLRLQPFLARKVVQAVVIFAILVNTIALAMENYQHDVFVENYSTYCVSSFCATADLADLGMPSSFKSILGPQATLMDEF